MDRLALCLVLFAGLLGAQTMCPPTPAYAICDIQFDLASNQSSNFELNAEFRGPSHRTFLLHGYRSGPTRATIRFSPFEPGKWEVRISSSIETYHDKQMELEATASNSPGWVEAANVHHFRYTGGERAAHLWVGDTLPESIDGAGLSAWVAARAAAGVNHVRLHVPPAIDEVAFDQLDSRLTAISGAGLIADLIINPSAQSREERQSYMRYVIARCAARNATWVLLDQFEKMDHAHDLLRELATYLNEDPFHHLKTVGSAVTAGPFADENWTNLRYYGSPDWTIAAVEHQIYPKPAVSLIQAPSAEDFRHQLWQATMSGSYPEAATTDATMLKYLGIWKQLLADSRHWDNEPFFEAVGARGLFLPDTEFILYLEKPGPVTVQLERKHKWNGEWVNPITGEHTELGDFKLDSFSGEPPDATHDWVLHIYREGHKESLKSYRFEARTVQLQEVEVDPAKVPFEIAQPSEDTLAFAKSAAYSAHLKKETRASRGMLYLWTGEVSADEEGYRVLGTGAAGTFRVPANIIRHFPGTLHVRLYGLNALGKLYSVDRNYGISQ